MATIEDEVIKSKPTRFLGARYNLVSLDTGLREKDASDIALRLSGVTFSSSSRGPTSLIGGNEGDHATAYAVYLRYAAKMIRKYLVDEKYKVTSLITELLSRPKIDEWFLSQFKLPKGKGKIKYERQLLNLGQSIQGLRNKGNKQINSLSNNIVLMRDLTEKVKACESFLGQASNEAVQLGKALEGSSLKKLIEFSSDISASVSNLQPASLEESIFDIRCNYFYMIAKEISERFLLYLNKSEYITFPQITTKRPIKGESKRVKSALKILARYNESEGNVDATSSFSLSGSAIASRSRMATAASSTINDENDSENEEDDEIEEDEEDEKKEVTADDVVDGIKALLFYPKLTEDDVLSIKQNDRYKNKTSKAGKIINNEKKYDKDVRDGVVRTNSLDIFGYVLLRHLFTIYKIFEKVATDGDRKGITINFINKMMDDWELSVSERKGLVDKILFCLKNQHMATVPKDGANVLNDSYYSLEGVSNKKILPPSPILVAYKVSIMTDQNSGATAAIEQETTGQDDKHKQPGYFSI